ncbi:aldo/keto reductase [Halobacillus sp. BBL2006]|uniref:aldo/keto reductase n=1 Tax=Halobacillus sp. BBL2006 TaxID=1543706 RepID=UPI0005439D36|nr:aldo/keto reductase [Halobacillus sp. BBL2006]KHE67567.1 glyoxal reductase [Halobacillus sp. BBL2006]
MSLTEAATLSNGINMPKVGLGVYKMENDEEVVKAVKSALEVGYRHIDTASFYDNEEGVGQAIKESNIPREDLFVTTKVWNDEQGYEETLQAFERSLNKLKLDYLDLYLIHWPVPGKFKDTWKALEKLHKDGKVKAIGVCNFMEHHLEVLMEGAEEKPMVNQVEFHPELYQKELADYCYQKGIQLEAWAPLARGRYFDAAILKQLAEKYDKSPAQIILRWHLQHDVVIIPKSSNKERQKENADLFDFDMNDDEMKRIDALHKNERIGKHPDEFDYEG